MSNDDRVQQVESMLSPAWKRFMLWAATGAGTLVLIGLLLWGIISFMPKGPSTVSVPATEAPEVKNAPTTTVMPKKPLKVFTAPAKAKLKLPDEVVRNPDQQVIAATQVKGSDRPQTITTTINTATGESQSFVKQDPLPWFAVETHGEARISYGYKISRGDSLPKPVVRLGVGYDVVRIKALTAGITSTVDSDGAAFVGVGAAYRW